ERAKPDAASESGSCIGRFDPRVPGTDDDDVESHPTCLCRTARRCGATHLRSCGGRRDTALFEQRDVSCVRDGCSVTQPLFSNERDRDYLTQIVEAVAGERT